MAHSRWTEDPERCAMYHLDPEKHQHKFTFQAIFCLKNLMEKTIPGKIVCGVSRMWWMFAILSDNISIPVSRYDYYTAFTWWILIIQKPIIILDKIFETIFLKFRLKVNYFAINLHSLTSPLNLVSSEPFCRTWGILTGRGWMAILKHHQEDFYHFDILSAIEQSGFS